MIAFLPRRGTGLAVLFSILTGPAVARSEILISEIHYHPFHSDGEPEPVGEEFLELHNAGDAPVNVGGWAFDRGLTFVIPAGTNVPAGGRLVIAADPDVFAAIHGTATLALGPWTGTLANSGETLRLVDATGAMVDEVAYADEGDWATRARGPLDLGHRGWIWEALHDGGGHTLELVQPLLDNRHGQNWSASAEPGGTPGAANSSAAPDIAPLILEVRHEPAIPTSSDTVRVSTELVDESPTDTTAVLRYRVDETGAFVSVPMNPAPDGTVVGEIPPQADLSVVEFFVEAADGSGHTRTWPGAVSPDGGQEANALYQVDDRFQSFVAPEPGEQPVHRIVMTPSERSELARIGSVAAESESNARMNAAFYAVDSFGIDVRYRVGIRNRGARSRTPPPNNHLVLFPRDDRWNGFEAVKFNARNVPSQVAGSLLFRRFGIEAAAGGAVQLRINGVNPAGGARMFGSYALLEPLGSDFTDSHWPDDGNGNLYQIRDDVEGGELQYEGPDPSAYQDSYFKQTNQAAADYSDLIHLTDVLNNAPTAGYLEAVEAVANLDQWTRFLAVDALLGNLEGGLTRGRGDDYVLYRGIIDSRFVLVPHDYDTLLAFHELNPEPNRDIFVYEGVTGLARLFATPEFLRRYYAAYLDLLDGDFRPEVLFPLLAQALGGWVPESEIRRGEQFLAARIAGVRAQIPEAFSVATNLQAAPPQGHLLSTDGAVTFSGTFHAARTRSVLVNGREAALDARRGLWSLPIPNDDRFLTPGLNRVTVRFFGGHGGSGALLHEERIDIWNRTNGSGVPVSGTLVGGDAPGALSMEVRDSHLPGIPLLVRVELHDEEGNVNRDRWDATALLSPGRPDVVLTPSEVRLFNGRGSALVTVTGIDDGGPGRILLPRGAVWRYLDDGSDQGTAWRAPDFDDASWPSGPAELGYGDNQATTVGFIDTNPAQNGNQRNATTYFRTSFDVSDAATVSGLAARLKYDDGAVVYLNGVELFKTPNMASDMPHDAFTVNGEDTPDENAYHEFPGLSATLLREGENTLAVEIKQGDPGSSDISFDLELLAFGASADPGPFTLAASLDGRLADRSLRSLAGEPIAQAAGTLAPAAGESVWSGVVHVTGDVIVPAGHTLRLAPGTLVLVDGDAAPRSTTGVDLIIRGRLLSEGTAAAPVTLTASNPDQPWGQILFERAEPSSFTHTEITRAGHSPGGGHTGHGRVIRIRGSDVSFDHCSITDHRGKVGEVDALDGVGSTLTVRQSHLARSVMGFETFDSAVLVEDSHITEMLGIYREDGVTDDDDAIYLHDAGEGRELVLRRLVVAHTDDDGIDTLGADVTIEDCISRDCFDKGVSILGGHVSITRTLLTGNDIGISVKDDADLELASVTAAGNASISLQVENKTGTDAASDVVVVDSILDDPDSIRTDYDPADVVVRHSIVREPWPGPGVLDVEPGFRDPAGRDYRLAPDSPAIDAGDPSSPTDPDGSAIDLGYRSFGGGDPAGPTAEVLWLADLGPYHIVDDVTIPEGSTLRIEAGTSIHVDTGKQLTVNGRLHAAGTAERRIRFAPSPDAALAPDPVGRGLLPDAPPKWAGIRIVDSTNPDNIISHVDIEHAQDSEGSIAVIRSSALIEHVTFHGTHLRMIYTDDASVVIQHCTFPDMFGPDERADELGLDNVSEQVKGIGGVPQGGRYVIRHNHFGTNKGHNDCIDVESGRRPEPIVQIIGNVFDGAGDELLDLGGDVYVADNHFRNVFKDDETSDRGHANAMSTGDGGPGTVINVVRNVFDDVDHAINLKIGTSTIFENNTVHRIHPDFIDRFDNPSIGAVVTLFIPTDINPQPGDGAYLSGNILQDLPRVFGGADLPDDRISPLEMESTLVDPEMTDLSVGPNHADQSVLDLGRDNVLARADFVDAEAGDFRLREGSPARGTGPLGRDRGAFVPDGPWIAGEPDALTTRTTADLLVGGPGIFAFRWKLDDGPWSEPVAIGGGFAPPAPTVRTAPVSLTNLADGPHTVFVLGQTFAGEWQDASAPTASRTWTVASDLAGSVRLNEVLADNRTAYPGDGSHPDFVELHNPGASPLDLGGFALSDDPDNPSKFVFGPDVLIPAGGYLVLHADSSVVADGFIHLGFSIGRDGESVTLFGPAAGGGVRPVIDAIRFGPQIPDRALARTGFDGTWGLATPTPGTANIPAPTGDPAGLRIGEWFAAGSVAYQDDFIEIRNPHRLPVELSGHALTDHASAPLRRYRFPDHSYIAGGGVAVVIADGAPERGPDHAPFRLSREGGTIALIAPDGSLMQTIIYGFQSADFTNVEATGDSGSGTSFAPFRLPTPGVASPAAGSADEAALARALALYDGLRITEIMYGPVQGADYEFIELTNIGPTPLNLEGVRFTEGISFTLPAVILAPGAATVVVQNVAAFESLYGTGLAVAGAYDGRLDNAGERLALTLPEPFEASILRFRYDDAWRPDTDGGGRSLVLADAGLPRLAWNDPAAWGSSGEDGGHPAGGTAVAGGFGAWLASHAVVDALGDTDADGLPHLLEYAVGLLPRSPEDPASVLVADASGPAGTVLRLRLPEVARADVTLDLLATGSLASGKPNDADWFPIASRRGGGAWTGPAAVTVRQDGSGWILVEIADLPAGGTTLGDRRFHLLRVTLTP